jgi:hypothetical protein
VVEESLSPGAVAVTDVRPQDVDVHVRDDEQVSKCGWRLESALVAQFVDRFKDPVLVLEQDKPRNSLQQAVPCSVGWMLGNYGGVNLQQKSAEPLIPWFRGTAVRWNLGQPRGQFREC